MPASQATLDLRVANAVACAASIDKSTPLVKKSVCVDVSKTGVVYVATDGQIMLADQRPRSEGDRLLGSYLLPAEILKQFKITKTGDTAAVLTKVSDYTLRLARGADVVDFDLWPADSFPNWRAILPAETSGEAAQYTGENLQRLLKAGGIMGTQRVMAIGHNGAKPAIVTWSDLPTFFGLISPYRLTKDESISAPAWASSSN